MIKKFLKSGYVSFAVGISVIIIYVFFSPYQVGPHTNGSVSFFNVLFTLLFLTSCCAVAYLYGKRKNKSGLIGLVLPQERVREKEKTSKKGNDDCNHFLFDI